MNIYIVTRKSDGVEVHRYVSDEAVEWAGFEFATHDHVVVVEPVTPTVPQPPVKITKLAFRNRFTQNEKIAIEIAALDDPTALMQQRAMSAALRASQQDVAVAQFIDLTRVDTRAGVQQLEAAGLLAVGRALEILDTEPTEQEVWNG
jgi:hypothetical protein